MLADRIASRVMGERCAPLSKGLPGASLRLGSTAPSLFENLVDVEREIANEVVHSLGPRILAGNEVTLGDRRKDAVITGRHRSAELVTRSVARCRHRRKGRGQTCARGQLVPRPAGPDPLAS